MWPVPPIQKPPLPSFPPPSFLFPASPDRQTLFSASRASARSASSAQRRVSFSACARASSSPLSTRTGAPLGPESPPSEAAWCGEDRNQGERGERKRRDHTLTRVPKNCSHYSFNFITKLGEPDEDQIGRFVAACFRQEHTSCLASPNTEWFVGQYSYFAYGCLSSPRSSFVVFSLRCDCLCCPRVPYSRAFSPASHLVQT